MGRIKQGILGGFSGRVANVVGSSWKGIAVIKAMPLSVANPKTAPQVANRNQFSQSVAYSKQILSQTVKPLLDRIAVQMSGYNLFTSLNKDRFDADGLVDIAGLIVSQGTVIGSSDLSGSVQAVNPDVDLAWTDNTGEGDALATDELYGDIYNETKNEVISIPPGTARSAESLTVVGTTTWDSADLMHVHAAFRRADGSRASDTSYAECSHA